MSVCNKKPGHDHQGPGAEAGNYLRQLRALLREHAKVAIAGLEVLHGVEYLEAALRLGQLKITKLIRKKVTYHDSCHLGRGFGVYQAPRNVWAPFPVSRLWR